MDPCMMFEKVCASHWLSAAGRAFPCMAPFATTGLCFFDKGSELPVTSVESPDYIAWRRIDNRYLSRHLLGVHSRMELTNMGSS